MTTSITKFRKLIPASATGIVLMLVGCADTTTREDVADARAALEREQEETDELMREGKEDIAQAQREAYEDSKPVIEEGREDVAEVEREVSESIREQQKEEHAAAAELRAAEEQLHTKQERDAYVKQMEHRLADIKLEIDELDQRASNAEGTEKEQLDVQIKTLQAQHDRAEEALEELRDAEPDEWEVHQQSVRMAMQDLDSELNTIR